MKLHWSPRMAAAHAMPSSIKMLKPPLCAKNPDANSSESPGRNGKNTTPVSIKMMRNTKPYATTGPAAMALAMAVRGSFSSSTMKFTNPMRENPYLWRRLRVPGLAMWRVRGLCLQQHPLPQRGLGRRTQCARWERAPARGSLWLLPSGPDQVRNSTSPEPIEHTHELILYLPGKPPAGARPREHQKPTSPGRHLASAATAPRRYATLGATKYRRRQNERPRHRHGRRA